MSTTTLIAGDVILLKEDFEILNSYIKNVHGMQVNEKENFRKLYQEIKKAQIVDPQDFPPDIVRLGSTVTVKDLDTKRDLEVTIVLPQHADIKQKKISVLAPVGTALIGFRKGRKVSWSVPAGKKDFKIMAVTNSHLP